jgi:UvrD-like helicase C-terminal domain/AAA domain/Exonuclease/PD-(D/E)XK nuclease superfamily
MITTFYDIVNMCNINVHDDKKSLKQSMNKLSKFIDLNIDKKQLIKIGVELNRYKKNKNTKENNHFIFKNKVIEPNEEQKNIIFNKATNHVRIIAGAGSGKTTTIICRVKYLLDNFTTPDKILILTFNRSICEDIKNKMKDLLGFEAKLDIMTIDKFCTILKYRYGFEDNKLNNLIKVTSLSELCIIGEEIMNQYGKEISKQYKYIFFDEFQDINKYQFNILKTFAENDCILTVIGDDNQNIYQFRGTDNYYIINFNNFIKNTITFHLTINYRSSQPIVNLANMSIHNNKDKIPKNMEAIKQSEKLPKFYMFNNTSEQCKFILKTMKRQMKKFDLKYDDFAILSRNGFPLKDYETYFCEQNIPCITLLSNKNYDYNNKVSIMKNHLTISTIHSAKGLEWFTVFVVGLGDEHFPSHVNNNIKNIEEERRLFYVGVTRAKRNLFFVSSIKELPLTRFIDEIDNKNIFTYKKKPISDDLFKINDKNYSIHFYGVTDLITSLTSNDIKTIKKEKLVFDEINNDNINNLYTEKLFFNDNISKKFLEADFGIFCDCVLTRKIMLNSNQKITDENTSWILNGTELEDSEMEIYNKYDLQKYTSFRDDIIKKQNIKNETDIDIVKKIFKKINPKYEVRRKNTYPDTFLTQLKKSYSNYCDYDMQNDLILKDIYYVSLSNKIKGNRRRLIYMNVFDIFMEGFNKINHRINDYADKIKNNKNICKMCFSHYYDKIGCTLSGELDLLDKTNKNNYKIIDFKCSNDDFKLEWIIQLLLYYCLYMENAKDNEKIPDIKSLCIFNIMNGNFYSIQMPKKYEHHKLLKFVQNVIKDILNSNRSLLLPSFDCELPKTNVTIKIESNAETETENKTIKQLVNKNGENMMILDVETNCERGEIIQISYIMMDKNYNLIKTVNKYIKDRLVSINSLRVNRITNDRLKQYGESFSDVMNLFIMDLATCNLIIGHNIGSDCRVINKNYSSHIDLFEKKEKYCTMDKGKQFCSLKGKNGKTKSPKLEELYFQLFKFYPTDLHDSMKDVLYTAECYVYMKFNYDELEKIVKKINKKNQRNQILTDVLERMV